MNVTCPNCATIYRVDPAKVPEAGVRARCAVCAAVFPVRRDASAATSAASAAAPDPSPAPPSTAPPLAPAEGAHRTAAPVRAEEASRADTAAVAPAIASPAAAAPPAPARPPVASPPGAASRPEAAPPRPEAAPRPASPVPAPAPPVVPTAAPRPAVARPAGLPPVAPRPAMPSRAPTAPAAPSAGPAAAGAGRKPVNPFLSQDPGQKARRLARALISDMVVYHPAKRREGLRDGTLKTLFEDEIKKSWEEYTDQVGRDVAESTTHFKDALNEILADGRQIF